MTKVRAGATLQQRISQTVDIGLRIVAARKAVGMSQADLCRATGLPSAQVSQWETGKRRPSLDFVVLLLPHLDVSLDYLFLGDFRGLSRAKEDDLKNAWENALEEFQDAAQASANARIAKSA